MTIAHVVHVLGTGDAHALGIARTAINLVESLDPSRYRLSVLCLRDDGAIGDRFREMGVAVSAMGWQGGRADIPGALRFARALRRAEPDIVHIHSGGLTPRFVSRVAAGAKVIVHYHSLREESGTRRGSRRSSLAADLVIANSEATALSVRGSKPLVVYPGVALHPRLGRGTSGHFTIGVAARLAPVKGISFLIGAIALLRERIPHLRLVIAGDGPERPKLETQVRASGLEKAVKFAGWIDDVAAELPNWDLYVQPSLAEGLGISVLEAMAAGIPVVASDVGGLKEVIDDGVTGFLVPPRDTVTLAERIAQLASDRSLRSRMGDASRAHVIEHFNLERESQAIRTAYEKLLA